jgi:PleD family two-component response regulator
MLTYQKLSSRTISLTTAKLMANQPEKNSRDCQPQELKREAKQFSQAIDDFVALPQSDRTAIVSPISNCATILIVDDTPNNLQVLFSYLETEGFKVLLAEDGESALQIAQSQTPDLILLDVLMPDLDGFETCRRLKERSSTEEIPIIFLTALSETVNKV